MDGPPAGGLLVAEVDNLADDFAEVERPLLARIEELQATVKRLNRRCQVAEAGVAAKFDSPLQEGRLADTEAAARAHDAGVERAALERAAKECDKLRARARASWSHEYGSGLTTAYEAAADAIRALAESVRTPEDRRASPRPGDPIVEQLADLPPGGGS